MDHSLASFWTLGVALAGSLQGAKSTFKVEVVVQRENKR
jgi:hypothetical protein